MNDLVRVLEEDLAAAIAAAEAADNYWSREMHYCAAMRTEEMIIEEREKMTVKEKIEVLNTAAAAKRAKFKLEFMVLMLNTGREKEAANAFNDALDAVKEIIKLEEAK